MCLWVSISWIIIIIITTIITVLLIITKLVIIVIILMTMMILIICFMLNLPKCTKKYLTFDKIEKYFYKCIRGMFHCGCLVYSFCFHHFLLRLFRGKFSSFLSRSLDESKALYLYYAFGHKTEQSGDLWWDIPPIKWFLRHVVTGDYVTNQKYYIFTTAMSTAT